MNLEEYNLKELSEQEIKDVQGGSLLALALGFVFGLAWTLWG